jgi:hypothetical protein
MNAPKVRRETMVSGARPDTLNDRLSGVAMTPLILGERLTDDFHPWDGGELLQDLTLSFPRLRAVHSHRDRPLRGLRAGDLTLCGDTLLFATVGLRSGFDHAARVARGRSP